LTDRQKALLAEGERTYHDKQYEAAAQQLSTFLDEVHNRPEVARALYVRGMARALTGKRAWAYADLERAARETTDPQLLWQPSAALGTLYFEDENWDAAARAFNQAIERMPAASPQDALLFRLGLCCERTGRWSAAAAPYRRIAAQFPTGVYAEGAQRRLQLNADHFAVQCGVFSQMDNANQLVAQLRKQGLRTYVQPEQRKDGACYVVLEGRYGGYPEANQALARVRGYVPQAVLWP
jgi:outer membrane protein assembly factor BamD (BamD/ComL family)